MVVSLISGRDMNSLSRHLQLFCLFMSQLGNSCCFNLLSNFFSVSSICSCDLDCCIVTMLLTSSDDSGCENFLLFLMVDVATIISCCNLIVSFPC